LVFIPQDNLAWVFCLIIALGFLGLLPCLVWSVVRTLRTAGFIKKKLMEACGGDERVLNRCQETEKFLDALEENEQLNHPARLFGNMLIRYPKNGEWYYCNRGEARDVFNERNLCGGTMGKGFVPSLLTGLGVLGTFVGLLYGLNDSGVSAWITGTGGELPEEEVKLRLGALLSGAGTAFVTSVWGIFASLIASTLITPLQYFRSILIRRLCRQIDMDYPPNVSSEAALAVISQDSGEADDQSVQGCIRGMSREIVAALNGMSDRMTEELSRKITMYIRDMDNRTTDVILKTLDKLEDRLNRAITLQTDTVKAAGEEFVNSARTATGIITAQYEKIGNSLDSYSRDIAANVADWQKTSESFAGLCSEMDNSIRTAVSGKESEVLALEEMAGTLNATVKELNNSASGMRQGISAVSELAAHFDERITVLRRATEELERGLQGIRGFEPRISESLDEMLEKNAGFVRQWSEAYNKTILTGVRELSNAIESLREK